MPSRIHGPYARQVLADGQRLKFWFVQKTGDRVNRFELLFQSSSARGRTRGRPIDIKPSRHASAFLKHLPPRNLSAYSSCAFPRHPGDTLAAAASSLLQGEDLADATRLIRFGIALDIVQNARHLHP